MIWNIYQLCKIGTKFFIFIKMNDKNFEPSSTYLIHRRTKTYNWINYRHDHPIFHAGSSSSKRNPDYLRVGCSGHQKYKMTVIIERYFRNSVTPKCWPEMSIKVQINLLNQTPSFIVIWLTSVPVCIYHWSWCASSIVVSPNAVGISVTTKPKHTSRFP